MHSSAKLVSILFQLTMPMKEDVYNPTDEMRIVKLLKGEEKLNRLVN